MKKQHPLSKTQHRAGAWVQTDRATHEAWALLSMRSPKAGALLHILTGRVGENNAVVMSHQTMADIMGCSRETIKRAIRELVHGNWIETCQIGPTGTVNAYVLNDRVAWAGPRDGRRYSKFSATVVVSADEQPHPERLGNEEPLRTIPRMHPGERQLPHGDGLPPPSEPALPGMEMDLPATRDERFGEAQSLGQIIGQYAEMIDEETGEILDN